jgi:hypothetical protein
MSFLGDTLLVPEHGALPNNFAFFKVIKMPHDDEFVSNVIPAGTRIVVTPKNRDSLVVATVVFSHVYDNHLLFLVVDDVKGYEYSVNTADHYIIEIDEVEGKVLNPKLETIGDAEENELIEHLRRDPSHAVRIPQVLWKRKRFQKKILSANLPLESDLIPENVMTMERLRRVDFFGKKTRTFHHDKLPDDALGKVNDFLDIETDPHALHEARMEKVRRTVRAPKCKGKCSISGGRTRRFKK